MHTNFIKDLSLRVRLVAGFAVVILLTWILGVTALQRIGAIYDITQTVYEHPLAVSNAALEVKVGVWRLDSAINNLFFADSPARVDAIVREVAVLRAGLGLKMRVIESQFLGKSGDVLEVYGALEGWGRTFDDIVALIKAGKTAEAHALHDSRVSGLEAGFDREIGDIIDFARTKATVLSQSALQQVERARADLLALLAALTLIGLLTSLLITRGITNSLAVLRDRMTLLAEGRLALAIPFLERRNELGGMARALQVFKESAQRLEDQRWLKSHVAEISLALQVAENREAFGTVLLGRLVPLLGGGIGLFSIRAEDSGRFVLAGRYGCDDDLADDHAFTAGLGLCGQCVVTRQSLLVDEVPEDYFRIRSGLGATRPRTLALLPVVSREVTLALIEIGALGSLTPLQRELLEEVAPVVALNLEIMERNLKTRQLLRQTRQQAASLTESEERLNRQAADLEEANAQLRVQTEELEAQTAELQASEEELRVQQEQLRVVNDQMAEKNRILEDQAAALRRSQAEAEQRAVELTLASRYKSEFLANMSHELRTPLNSLLILAKSLVGNQEGNLNADQVESAEIIRDSGTQLLSLINDILDIAKVESGKMRVVAEDVALPGIADTVSRRFKGMARVKGLDYKVVLAPDLPEIVRTDGGKIEQILNNLVGNAIKFTERGGVTVTFCRHQAGSVPNPVGIKGDVVAFSVVDTGIGISESLIDRIFLAFEQGDGASNRRYSGTGLGLSIARKLARLLGGDIFVHSEEGRGSSFTLVVPVAPPLIDATESLPPVAAPVPPEDAPAVLPPPFVPDDRETIRGGDRVMLVVEDDRSFARVVAGIVREKGFKCLVAGDGESAVLLASRFHPLGIVLDVGLPGLDGWGVMERLHAQADTREIPVHVVSGADTDARARQMGAVGALTKPVSAPQIEEALARMVRAGGGTPPRRLVIADADAGVRAALAGLVGADGVQIAQAASGEAVAACLRSAAADCLVIDIDLPGGGPALLESLARMRAEGLPPVIILSDRDLTREEASALRAFTDTIIVKSGRSEERLLNEVRLFLHAVSATLPLGQRPPPPPMVASAALKALAGRTVLVVDDDMRNSFALSKVLRARGLRVLLAQDGRKALVQLDNNPAIELVVMDIMMPGMDGCQTMREIRKEARWAALPIIAVTAKAMRGDRDKCLEAGANDYLSKPIDTDELFEMMNRLIAG